MTKEHKIILKSASVLLIEDNLDLRAKFVEHLNYYVGKVVEASNGLEALKLYEDIQPSFIITDIEMPEMDGLEFINIIRNKNTQIPILITTAYSSKEYLLSAIKLQLIEYLVKPVQLDLFFQALENIATILEKTKLCLPVYLENSIYDPLKKTFIKDGIEILLTKSEIKLIEILILNKGNLVTKNMIETKMYIFKEMSETALKNVVFKLRKKIGNDIIKTVEKLGYIIE